MGPAVRRRGTAQTLSLVLSAGLSGGACALDAPPNDFLDREPRAYLTFDLVSVALHEVHGQLVLGVTASWQSSNARPLVYIDGVRVGVLDTSETEKLFELPAGDEPLEVKLVQRWPLVERRVEIRRGPEARAVLGLRAADPEGSRSVYGTEITWHGDLTVDADDDTERARQFLEDHGAAFGLDDQALDNLRLTRIHPISNGRVVVFEQTLDGITPIEEGRVAVRVREGRVRSVDARLVAVPEAMGEPSIDAAQARARGALRGTVLSEPLLVARKIGDGATLAWRLLVQNGEETAVLWLDPESGDVLDEADFSLDFLSIIDWPSNACDQFGCAPGSPGPLMSMQAAAVTASSILEAFTGKPGWCGDEGIVWVNIADAGIARYNTFLDIIQVAPGAECPLILGHEWSHAVGYRIHGPSITGTTGLEEGIANVVGAAVGNEMGLGFSFGAGCSFNFAQFGLMQPTHSCAWSISLDEGAQFNHVGTALRLAMVGGTAPAPNGCATTAAPVGSVYPITDPVGVLPVLEFAWDAYVLTGRSPTSGAYAEHVLTSAGELMPSASCSVKKGFMNAGLVGIDADCNNVIDELEIDAPPVLDNDGISDDVDNCPHTFNPEQLDSDGDGVGNSCDEDDDNDDVDDEDDNCPYVANPGQKNADGDMFGDACDDDEDADGIFSEDDNCPLDANPGQHDLDGDGIGNPCDPDVDGDGIDNEADGCRYVADDGSDTDGDHIPDACDNCSAVANEDQDDCDSDGIGNACEPVPVDSDNDSVPDEDDNCDCDANPNQLDKDGNGVGDACEPIPHDFDDPFEPDGRWSDPSQPAFVPIPMCPMDPATDPRAWPYMAEGLYDGHLTVDAARGMTAALRGPYGIVARASATGSEQDGWRIDLAVPVQPEQMWHQAAGQTQQYTLELSAPEGAVVDDPLGFSVQYSCG